jgi:hypothetical protein
MHTADQKAWKGKGMEGGVARWYARTRRNDMKEFCREAGIFRNRVGKARGLQDHGFGY